MASPDQTDPMLAFARQLSRRNAVFMMTLSAGVVLLIGVVVFVIVGG